MKKAIALCGGGSRGSYHIGAWKALRELGESFDIVTGTSIGALNGAFMVQEDFDAAYELWRRLTVDDVMKDGINFDSSFEAMYNQKGSLKPFLKHYVAQKGADISPFLEILEQYCHPQKFFSSAIDFGLVTVEFPSLTPCEIRKAEMNEHNLKNWLLASASCFPAFPICKIGEKSYVDGGYYDNLPISLALKMGADEVLAIDLHMEASHPQYMGKPFIKYSKPCWELGSMLLFEQDVMRNNMQLGYYDMMKNYGKLYGYRYTFDISAEREKICIMSRKLLLAVNEAEAEIQNKSQNALLIKLKNALSQAPLTEILTEYTDHLPLSPENYLLRAAENAGEIARLDPLKEYTLQEFNKNLFATFRDGRNYDYKAFFRCLTDFKNPSQMKNALEEIDLHYLVGCLYHYAKLETAENVRENSDFKKAAFLMPRAVLAVIYLLFAEHNCL